MKKSLFLLCLLSTSLLLNSCGDESESSSHSYTEEKVYQKMEKECRNDEERRFLRAGYEGDSSLIGDSSLNEDVENHVFRSVYIEGAALGGHERLVKMLLEKYEKTNAEQSSDVVKLYKNNALFGAAMGGHRAMVESLLEQGADPIAGLVGAVSSEQKSLIEMLLSSDCEMNVRLYFSAYCGYKELVEHLLEKGASPDWGVAGAADGGHKGLVHLLLKKGANPNEGLDGAINGSYSEILNLLLDNGADVNEALREATCAENSEIVKQLIARGADPNQCLWFLIGHGITAGVKILLDNGARVDAALLTEALGADVEENLQLLLDKNANKICLKTLQRRHEAVKYMLDKGVNASSILEWVSNNLLPYQSDALSDDFFGDEQNGNIEIVKLLLDSGAEPTAGLSAAVQAGHIEIVKLLLDSGADPTAGLGAAVQAGHIEIVKLLLDSGAKPTEGRCDGGVLIRSHEEYTLHVVELIRYHEENPLHVAAATGNVEIVKLLLDSGAEPTAGLRAAVQAGHIEIVKLLLDNGADPTAGFIAAVGAGHIEIVKLLLDSGADPTEGRCDGGARIRSHEEYPLHVAAATGNVEIVKLLLTHTRIDVNSVQVGRTVGYRKVSIVDDEICIDGAHEFLILKGGFYPAYRRKYFHISSLPDSSPGFLRLQLISSHTSHTITPLDEAIYNGHNECAEHIRAAGGKTWDQIRSEKAGL